MSKFDLLVNQVRGATENKTYVLATASFDAGRLVRNGSISLALARASLLCATILPEEVAAPIIDAGLINGQATSSLPMIKIDTDEHRVVVETVDSLRADPELYTRGCVLVRIGHSPEPTPGIRRSETATHVQRAPAANIRERTTKYAKFEALKKAKKQDIWVPTHPPKWLVDAIAARGEWPGIRPLLGVSDIPVLRPDGGLHQTAGYDESTCVLYEPKVVIPTIPQVLTIDDARRSALSLLDLVVDFPFATPAGKAAWLASLLTVIGRHVFSGPAPLFMVNANVAATGKSMLVRLVSAIALGHEPATSGYTKDIEEMRKTITSVAIAGDAIMLLDNIDVPFGDAAIDRMLTAVRWSDRLLGKNENASAPLTTVWFGTANNVTLAADTHRRLLEILLDCLDEHPEERTNFTYPRLIDWALEHRSELARHALIIMAAYLRAGRPAQGLSAFGSYEGWSDCVRSAVVWPGLDDPCLTRVAVESRPDEKRDDLDTVIAGWAAYDPSHRGVVIARAIRALYSGPPCRSSSEAESAMRTALETLSGCLPHQQPDARKVGNKLRGIRRRPRKGIFIDSRSEDDTRDGATWRLFSTGAPHPVRLCDSGDSPAPQSYRENQGGMGG